jgi:DNA processing protein
MAAGLAQAGAVVVSGMARGIDTAAHLGASGPRRTGGTIAVVAGGIDVSIRRRTPACLTAGARRPDRRRMPPGTEPIARHFPRRNRIISGLSRAVVVIEAAPQIRLLDYGPLRTRSGPRGDGRSRLSPRSALPWGQSSHPGRRRLVEDFDQVLESLDGLAGPNLKFHENLNFDTKYLKLIIK